MGPDDHDTVREALEVAAVLGLGQLVRLVLVCDAQLLTQRLSRPPAQLWNLYDLNHLHTRSLLSN